MLAYFQNYARHFGLEKYIRFNTPIAKVVETAERSGITLENGEQHHFDYLFAANGTTLYPLVGYSRRLHWRVSAFPATKPMRPLPGKRVLVIGAGNSGCDCAVEISRVARHVVLACAALLHHPKFMMGKPTDTYNKLLTHLPHFVRQPLQS